MVSVDEADKLIQKSLKCYSPQRVNISQALGRVLGEDIRADRDLPPFDKALMDGITVNSKILKSKNNFAIEGVQAAGIPALKTDWRECVEIMTGAVVPSQYDCVIPVEATRKQGNQVIVQNKAIYRSGTNIRRRGLDHKKGHLLLKKGSVLTPSHIAIACAVGKSKLLVSPALKAAIVSTGDEIVSVGKNPKPFQIRESNAYFIEAALKQSGSFKAVRFHCVDQKDVLRKSLRKILKDFDVIILSGGVSMGQFDYVPVVLKELGVKIVFYKVAQKPGKPMWFGMTKDRKPVFALPGNPVSTQVGTRRYVLKHMERALGFEPKIIKGILSKNFISKTPLTQFIPVKVNLSNGKLNAQPVATGGSGDFASLANTDGFIQLPAGSSKSGYIGEIYLWDRL